MLLRQLPLLRPLTPILSISRRFKVIKLNYFQTMSQKFSDFHSMHQHSKLRFQFNLRADTRSNSQKFQLKCNRQNPNQHHLPTSITSIGSSEKFEPLRNKTQTICRVICLKPAKINFISIVQSFAE